MFSLGLLLYSIFLYVKIERSDNMTEKLSFYLKDWKTIPNIISIVRILLIPIFALLFYKGNTFAAVIILAVSGLSDLIDGKIARKYNQVSNLGKILDPVADKLTVFLLQ